jgi:hypothetical protein
MRAHLLVVNRRGEHLIDGPVEDFYFDDDKGKVIWTTLRLLGEEREEHEHELDLNEVEHFSWARYVSPSQDTLEIESA